MLDAHAANDITCMYRSFMYIHTCTCMYIQRRDRYNVCQLTFDPTGLMLPLRTERVTITRLAKYFNLYFFVSELILCGVIYKC